MQDVRAGNCLIMRTVRRAFKRPTPHAYVFQGTSKCQTNLLKRPNVLFEMPEKQESPHTQLPRKKGSEHAFAA